MKYLVINDNDVIICISDSIQYHENGNVIVNNGKLAIAPYLVKEVVEIDETQVTLPEDLVAYKYQYVDGEFIINPHRESSTPVEELKSELSHTKAKLETLMVENESLNTQVTDLQLALCDLYESIAGGM